MQIKITPDKVFEILVCLILRKNGFHAVLPKQRIQGRATNHQIDSAGLYSLQIPFVYPIVLIAEAKLWQRRVDLPVLHKFLGILEDLHQNLPSTLNTPALVNWPADLYSGGISANYLGAIFTNIGFTRRAENFAHSHGIFLVPLKVKADWAAEQVRKLIEELTNLHGRDHPPEDFPEGGWEVLHQLFHNPYEDFDDEKRDRLTEVIRRIVDDYDDYQELRNTLNSLYLAAVDGFPIVIEMEPDSMASLYAFVLQTEEVKYRIIREEGRLTGFETPEWFEAELGPKAMMKSRDLWKTGLDEKQWDEEEKPVPMWEVEISVSFRNAEVIGSTLLSETIIGYLKKAGRTTFALPLSRGLVVQIQASFE